MLSMNTTTKIYCKYLFLDYNFCTLLLYSFITVFSDVILASAYT